MIEPRWDLSSRGRLVHALLLVLGMALTFPVGFLVIAPAVGLEPEDVFSGSTPALLTTALMGLFSLGGVLGAGLLAFGRVRPKDLGWGTRNVPRDLAVGGAGVAALVAAFFGIVLAFGLEPSGVLTTIGSFTGAQRLQMLMIGLIAGLGEESLFRGYLQPALVARRGALLGVVMTAAIFALYHLPVTPHWIGLSGKLAFGLILGVLRERTDSVLAPALAHFGFWQVIGFA